MDFLNNIVITEITHASVEKFDTGRNCGGIKKRPWHGIAFGFSGDIIYLHGEKRIPLSDNQIVYLPKGETYTIDCTRGGSFGIINFQTSKENIPKEFVNAKINNFDSLKREFGIIHDFVNTDNPCRQNGIFSSFYKILSLIAEDTSKSSIPYVLNSAMDFIDKNMTDTSLSNEIIAEHIGISEVYLRKLFTKHLSISVKKFIQNKRIERAKRLLTETNMQISEIADECGYSSIYHFCRSFKKLTSDTPTEYKKRSNINLF